MFECWVSLYRYENGAEKVHATLYGKEGWQMYSGPANRTAFVMEVTEDEACWLKSRRKSEEERLKKVEERKDMPYDAMVDAVMMDTVALAKEATTPKLRPGIIQTFKDKAEFDKIVQSFPKEETVKVVAFESRHGSIHFYRADMANEVPEKKRVKVEFV